MLYSARRSLNSRNGLRVGDKYTLGTGHVIFFHNKFGYIKDRFYELSEEMKLRGMNPQSLWPDDSWIRDDMWGDYEPQAEDFVIIKSRIKERILRKIEWYRYYKKPITMEWVTENYS